MAFLAAILFLLTACSKPIPAPEAGADAMAPMPQSGGAPGPRLIVHNNCAYPIWMQQQNMPAGTPEVVNIASGGSTSYNIPAAGLASTRFWPKTGCDANGQNCKMGQSSPPCPSNGCQPPVDSKLEATWGCTLQDPNQCAMTPQGHRIDATTWWNASAVDGYTLPYTIIPSRERARPDCAPVDCSGLTAAGCPSDDDLSTDGKFPQYAHQNERLTGPSFIGCFSTCMKLNYPTYGGDNAGAPQDPALQMYCCPTPPISSPQCIAGPVPKTKYVQAVHAMCKHTVYGFAYDDGVGLRNCAASASFTVTFGPNCP